MDALYNMDHRHDTVTLEPIRDNIIAWIQACRYGMPLHIPACRQPTVSSHLVRQNLDPIVGCSQRCNSSNIRIFLLILLAFSPGHTLHEIFILREGRFQRIPDLVVWPSVLYTCTIITWLLITVSEIGVFTLNAYITTAFANWLINEFIYDIHSSPDSVSNHNSLP